MATRPFETVIDTLRTGDGRELKFYSLTKAAEQGLLPEPARMPMTLKILAEDCLYHGNRKGLEDITAWVESGGTTPISVAIRIDKIYGQDMTTGPMVVDLAAMRAASEKFGGDPNKVNLPVPFYVACDHSTDSTHTGRQAFGVNLREDIAANAERYGAFKWMGKSMQNVTVLPPGYAIGHQAGAEFFDVPVYVTEDGFIRPQKGLGLDSHTPTRCGNAQIFKGVGGIEAEVAALGQPYDFAVRGIIRLELKGKFTDGASISDLMFLFTKTLRDRNVTGQIVEITGDIEQFSLAQRHTISNGTPEYGAVQIIWHPDQKQVAYMELTGRDHQVVDAYQTAQEHYAVGEVHTETMTLNLEDVVPAFAGPLKPQQHVPMPALRDSFVADFPDATLAPMGTFGNGSIVHLGLVSCTQLTPENVAKAALAAIRAAELGLEFPEWVKVDFSLGSPAIKLMMEKSGLMAGMEKLEIFLGSMACSDCIGRSGKLPPELVAQINDDDLIVCSATSGNRTKEGRVSDHTKANYLGSPSMLVPLGIAGTVNIDMESEPIGYAKKASGDKKIGDPVYARDLQPSNAEVLAILDRFHTKEAYAHAYRPERLEGGPDWQALTAEASVHLPIDPESHFVKPGPWFEGFTLAKPQIGDVEGARIYLMLGDDISTDVISPAGTIKEGHPAGRYLEDEFGLTPDQFEKFGARRMNHKVMERGTFDHPHAGMAIHHPSGTEGFPYDIAMMYQETDTPLVVFGGERYGRDSSRDWAAKGTYLQGVRVVVAESFESIHMDNLTGMGVLPLIFPEGESAETLGLKGPEVLSFRGIAEMEPNGTIELWADGEKLTDLLVGIDSHEKLEVFMNGGVLHLALRNMLADQGVAA